jgi:DNA-binding response OmpR family regulator
VTEGAWPDVVVVAPATCNTVGKLVWGITDNFPLLVIRAAKRTTRVIVVPSMNTEMWHDPQLQRNVDLLNATEKYRVVCPRRGEMLGGSVGFGAQASLADVVTETYRALGIVDDEASETLGGFRAPSAQEPLPGDEAAPQILLVDEDRELRQQIVRALSRAYPGFRVQEFDSASEALAWDQPLDLLVTELGFVDGAQGPDLIESMRRRGDQRLQVIAMSRHDRRTAGAEVLASRDVLFQQKPLNVPFLAGMIGGCLDASRRETVPLTRRRLRAAETLVHEGDHSSEIYVLESGRLRVVKEHEGREVTLVQLQSPAIVGEMSLFADRTRYATIVAEVDSELVEIDLDDVLDYLDRQPAWLRALIQSLVEHLRRIDERVLMGER